MIGSNQEITMVQINAGLIATLNKKLLLAIIFASIILITALDYFLVTGLNFSIFYTFPIIMCTWYASSQWGYIAALLSVALWFAIELIRQTVYPSVLIPIWEITSRLGYFIIIIRLLVALQKRLRMLEKLSITDHLTGALNSRGFFTAVETHIARARRLGNPVSIAYIDVDNFKKINDTMGHDAGDELLREIVRTIKKNIRKYDILGRFGGDEFVVFFSIENAKSALTAVRKVFNALKNQTKELHMGVSFSIGMVTTKEIPGDIETLIKKADEFMYTVKHSGKNRIFHKEFRIW
ncbi:MAG: GGDEF domain-containing protein [Spirochaetales bacterium]|nr:GGDEF domain-containing protein [Spirochaetales bacterium]